jgi:uncharacterized protein (DUF924 family)
MNLVKRVLEFWFTDSLKLQMCSNVPAVAVPPTAFKLWFGASQETDTLITSTFAEDLNSLALNSQLRDELKESPEGSMALLLIFDQFPRNIFRNRKEAFSYDHIALDAANLIRAKGWDLQMNPIYRGFAYLVRTASIIPISVILNLNSFSSHLNTPNH